MTQLGPVRTPPNNFTLSQPIPSLVTRDPMTTSTCWIDQLPDELISSILVVAFAMGMDSSEDNSCHKGLQFPSLVQLVSRRWRAIALSTPGLWTALSFRRIGENTILPHLQRSGILALGIYAGLLPLIIKRSGGMVDEAVRVADHISETHSQRIRKLHIHTRTTTGAHLTIDGLPTELPNLIHLSIYSNYCDSRSQNRLTVPTTRMKSLHLINYMLDWSGLTLSSNLETLLIDEAQPRANVNSALLVEALRGCPQLRQLKLRNQTINNDPRSVPVVLGRLEVLSLKGFSRSELITLLRLIQTPQLKALVVQVPVEHWRHYGQFELQLPMLESLEVGSFGVCLEFSRLLPDVKHLGLVCDPEESGEGEVQRRFGLLTSYWGTLPYSLPLESLKTNGVTLTSLLTFLDTDGRGAVVPYLRKLTVYVRDVFLTRWRSKAEFLQRGEERERLERLVELEVYGIEEGEDLFETWEELLLWKRSKCTSR